MKSYSVLLNSYITMKVWIIFAVCVTSSLAFPNLKIIGGHDATKGEYPYQVSLQGCLAEICEHVCGGTILNERWILTAARCVNTKLPPLVYQERVLVGSLSFIFPDEGSQIIQVSNYTIHPQYNATEVVNPFDIALLHLAEDITFNASVQAAKLPSSGSQYSGEAVVTGWGTIANPPNKFTPPVKPLHLQTVNVTIMDWKTCNEFVGDLADGPFTLNQKRNICTGSLNSDVTVCAGDAGGPLIQNGTVIGVVSWGANPCGQVGAPSVYTSTYAFIDWINSVINKA